MATRSFLWVCFAVQSANSSHFIPFLAFVGPDSPKSVRTALTAIQEQCLSEGSSISIETRLAGDYEGMDSIELVLDATYCERTAIEIAERCIEESVPLAVLALRKTQQFDHRVSYIQGSFGHLIAAFQALKVHFGFQTVNFLSDLSDFSLYFSSHLPNAQQYDVQIVPSGADASTFIGKVTRPKGNRVSFITTSPHNSKQILFAQRRMHVGGVGFANVFPLMSVLSNEETQFNSEDLSGSLIVVPAGFECVETEVGYFSMWIHRLVSVAESRIEVNTVDWGHSRFSIVNVQGGRRVVVGTITDAAVDITGQVVFLGNSSVTPSSATAPLAISGNFGNLDPIDNFYPLYLYFYGSMLALTDISHRSDLLPSFSLNLWNFTAGHTHFDLGFVSRYVMPHRDKFGAAILASISSSNTIPFAQLLKGWNVTVPIVGSSVTHPMLSSKKEFPYFLRTCLSDEYMNIVTVQIFKRLGWTNFAVISGKSAVWLAALEDLKRISAESGLHIVTAPAFQAVSFVNSLNDAAGNYTAHLKHFIDTRARVLLVLGPPLAKFLPVLLYDLGLRQGDVIIVAREWLMNSYLSYDIDPAYFPQTIEILSGALQFSPDRFVGPVGRRVSDDFKAEYGVEASTFACSYYDSTMVIGYALDWLIESGQDFLNGTAMMHALRTTRFQGCTGSVAFDGNSNDRTPMRYLIETVRCENGTCEVSKAGTYDPLGITLLKFEDGFLWGDGTKRIPTDIRGSSLGCPFEDRLIADFPAGRKAFYGACAVSVVLLLVACGLGWRYRGNIELWRLRERKEIEPSDVLIMLGVVGDFIIYFLLSPSVAFARLREIAQRASLQSGMRSGMYLKLWIAGEVTAICWLVGKAVSSRRDSHTFSQKMLQNAVFIIEDWLFVPLFSVLLRSFECVHGVSTYTVPPGFYDSYLESDCCIPCWQGTHLILAVISAATILVYIPTAVISRPLWQESQAELNIKTSHIGMLVKSGLQGVLVVLSLTLEKRGRLAYAMTVGGVWVGYLGYSLRWKIYGYQRTQLWHVASVSLVLWSTIVSLFQISISDNAEELLWTVLNAAGWCMIVLFTLIYQWLRVPALLFRAKGVNTIYLFKFAFQRTHAAIVHLLEAEFQRTGQDRLVFFRTQVDAPRSEGEALGCDEVNSNQQA